MLALFQQTIALYCRSQVMNCILIAHNRLVFIQIHHRLVSLLHLLCKLFFGNNTGNLFRKLRCLHGQFAHINTGASVLCAGFLRSVKDDDRIRGQDRSAGKGHADYCISAICRRQLDLSRCFVHFCLYDRSVFLFHFHRAAMF